MAVPITSTVAATGIKMCLGESMADSKRKLSHFITTWSASIAKCLWASATAQTLQRCLNRATIRDSSTIRTSFTRLITTLVVDKRKIPTNTALATIMIAMTKLSFRSVYNIGRDEVQLATCRMMVRTWRSSRKRCRPMLQLIEIVACSSSQDN